MNAGTNMMWVSTKMSGSLTWVKGSVSITGWKRETCEERNSDPAIEILGRAAGFSQKRKIETLAVGGWEMKSEVRKNSDSAIEILGSRGRDKQSPSWNFKDFLRGRKIKNFWQLQRNQK